MTTFAASNNALTANACFRKNVAKVKTNPDLINMFSWRVRNAYKYCRSTKLEANSKCLRDAEERFPIIKEFSKRIVIHSNGFRQFADRLPRFLVK